jgi:tetratricopeptide (TPR) repeat protein
MGVTENREDATVPSRKKNEFTQFCIDTWNLLSKNLRDAARMGLLIGLIIIVGYALSVCPGNADDKNVCVFNPWRLLFFLALIAASSYISGFFLGFIFGIPKRKTTTETDYQLNNNLTDISDWLTKIIIGLGLVELRQVPQLLESIGKYVMEKTDSSNQSLSPFTTACVVYFSILGFYYGYTYMRLYMSLKLRDADDRLLNKLDETAEFLKEKNTAPRSIDGTSKTYIEKYVGTLQIAKKEEDYTFRDWLFRAANAYHHGEKLLSVGYMQNALKKSLPADNDSLPEAYDYMGVAYLEMEMYDKANDVFSKIRRLFPTYPMMADVYYNNGFALEKMPALNDAERASRMAEAEALYDNAIALKPDHVLSLSAKSACYLEKTNQDPGNLEMALSYADKVIALDPQFETAHYNRACALARLGRKDEMLASLKTAILLEPNNKAAAQTDSDFANFRNDPDFVALTS